MSVAIAYNASGGSSYNVVFDSFLDAGLPRSFGNTGSFSESANGTSILSGPGYAQKFIWALNGLFTKEEAEELYSLFIAWDNDRAQGRAAAVGLLDQTFGGSLNTTATFTTPPSFTKNGEMFEVSVGLTQV